MDISKEEINMSARLEAPGIDAIHVADARYSTEGVAPGVLAAVILGVLCVIGVMFSLAVLMDRWNRRLHNARSSRGTVRSTKIPILDEMCESPESDPPLPSTSVLDS